jgi:hypothetical protein
VCPPEAVGTVSAVFRLASRGAAPVGLLFSGYYASAFFPDGDTVSLWSVYLIAGAVEFAAAAAIWIPLRRYLVPTTRKTVSA